MRRWTLALVALVVVSVVASACAPAAAPAPTAAATKAPEAAKPTAEASKPSAPTPTTTAAATPAAKPAASADWKAEWDKTVAAAKQEGKVVVAGGRGEPYRTAVMTFKEAYPDIELEFTGVDGADFSPKIQAERRAGQYLWDIWIGGSNTFFSLIPEGVLDPIRPALLLPEVKDETKWLGGFDGLIADKEHKYVFGFEGRRDYIVWVNRAFAPESELNKADQLLDPKWKGKIVWMDPRNVGSGGKKGAVLYDAKGEDWLRKLFAQDITIVSSGRPVIEALVRGTHPVALGVNAADIVQYRREGLADDLKPLDPDSPGMSAVTSGFGNLTLVNKAAHPNAARVFLNWFLSAEGQTAYVKSTEGNSRRLDVEGPEETKPKLGLVNSATEAFNPNVEKSTTIAKEVIK